MVKTVAIIGAGISGLGAIKACLEEGLEPTCFERSDDIGGLWRFTTSVCRLEKHTDFPVNGQWLVTTESNGVKKADIFDAVMVCTGQHAKPAMHLENLPGIDIFKGKVLHCREYKRPIGFDGKQVLIIGMGNTGVDIATELCTKASQVYLSCKTGVWVFQRLGKGGLPFDLGFLRRSFDWINNIMPPAVSRWMLKKYMNDQFNHDLYNIQPEGTVWREPLVNEELPSRIMSGSIMIKQRVKKFTETSVHFEDGSVVENLDIVILATGYEYSFPFLDESIIKKDESKGSFYKKIIPLGIEKPTLAFIAFILPIGPTMVVAELQSRWATRLFKGLHKLPDPVGMREEMQRDEQRRKKWFATSENNFRRTNYISYMDDLATDIGVRVNIWKLFLTDPVLAWKVVFGPCNSYQFRLTGSGKWDGAREAIMTQWDRIEKPLSTRVVKKKTKSNLLSYITWILWAGILILAMFLKG
ncbi:flavin-containing monooxygenase 3-like isoform X2 [Engystomops pustulosus]|uniref:flavin-containing monooxygenase 3-like isoform X2 n=1 Tax=Engystomops pustulosus TaxID=76066 RepID=UPI003AFB26AC